MAAFAVTAVNAATLGNRAVQCAAFNYGNWDYEFESLSPEDRSDGWKAQAEGFARVATRDGMSAQEVTSYIRRHRGAMKSMITKFVLTDDKKADRTFRALSRQCDKIIRQEAEMAPFR